MDGSLPDKARASSPRARSQTCQSLTRRRARSSRPSSRRTKYDRPQGSAARPDGRRRRDRGRRAEVGSSRPLPKRLSWIERVAYRLADEDQQREHEGDRDEAAEAEPWRLDVGLALREQLAERGRARRQTEAEKVERGQRHHRG